MKLAVVETAATSCGKGVIGIKACSNDGYRNDGFSTKMEENAVQEAAAGLESIEKLIRLLSQGQQQQSQSQQQQQLALSSGEMEMDCRVVADVAVSKFKKVISLLGRTGAGHARFRRAPLLSPPN